MEVLVALSLTTIAVLAVVSVFPTSLQSVQESGDSLQAQAIAQYCLDKVREYYQTGGTAPAALQPSTSYTFYAPAGQQFRSSTQSTPTYTVSYTATNVAVGSTATPEHDILLSISWTGVNGTHTRTFEEYVQN